MKDLQERGLGTGSAFGGTGNNTNASAGSLYGNNSVTNSNTNYAASFALSYQDNQNNIVPNSVATKAEKIATTTDIQKAVVSMSRVAPEMEYDNEWLASQDIPFLEESWCMQPDTCVDNPVEIGKVIHFDKGIKTLCKHKRLRNIKAFLLNKDIIRQAIYDAHEGKKASPQMTWVMHHIDETVDKIYDELKNETYVPKVYMFRTIHNHDDKTRHLAILRFYDRCVQQLLKIVIQEKLRALEPRNVYSNLPKRGTLSGTAKFCLYSQMKHDFHIYKDGYGLKLDIHHCYESISSDIVQRELFKYVTDAFTRKLIKRMFTHIHYLPIGDPLSGLYVNLVLRRWHLHMLNDRHHLFDTCYFFCDDALFINRSSKEALHELCREAREWLPKYANLYVKNNYQIYRLSEGITFCGARVFPNKILIRQLIKKRIIRAKYKPLALASYKGILEKTNSGHLSQILDIKNVSNRVRQYNTSVSNGKSGSKNL